MSKIFLALAVILVLLPLAFSGDCSSPYFKSVVCSDLNNNFDFNGFVFVPLNTNFITASGELDWNIQTNKVASFDGVGDYISVAGDSSLSFNPSVDSYSICYNFYADGPQPTTAGAYIIGTVGISDKYPFRHLITNDNAINQWIWDGSTNTGVGCSISLNKWYHLCTTWEPSTARMYLDGTLCSSTTRAKNSFTGSPNIKIAITPDSSPGYYFKGLLDDVLIFDSILSDTDVNDLFLAGRNSPAVSSVISSNGLDTNLVARWAFDGNYEDSSGGSNNGTITGGTHINKELDQNLVAYYKFNEASGTTIYDSARGNNGTLTNGALVNARGMWDSNALYLDGTNDYVNCGNSSDFNFERTNSFSMRLWFKTTTTLQKSILSKVNPSGANSGYTLQVSPHGVTGTIGFYIYNNWGTGNSLGRRSTYLINDGAWHHVLVTYDGSNDVSGLKLYLDGVSVTGSTQNNLTGTIITTGSLILGGTYYNSAIDAFSGSIDEVAIWNKTLSEEEVIVDYNSFLNNNFVASEDSILHAADNSLRSWTSFKVNENLYYDFGKEMGSTSDGTSKTNELQSSNNLFDSNLVGLWHFNNNLLDSSGNEANGSWNGSEGYFSGLWDTNTLNLTGSKYVTIADNPKLQITGNMSIFLWAYPADHYETFVAKRDAGGTNYQFYTYLSPEGKLRFYCGTVASGNTTLTLNQWSHIGIVIRDGIGTFYLNGKPDGTAAFAVTSDDAPMTIGKYPLGNEGYIDGKIEELAIWNKALTQQEITELYNSQASQFYEPNMVALWHLNGNALDSSGNGNNGSWGGGEAYASGLWNTNAGEFDGNDDYIDTGAKLIPATSDFSFAMWFYANDQTSQRLLTQYASGQDGRLSLSYSDTVAGTLQFYIEDMTPISVTGVSANNWHHIVITRDSTKIYIYVDGVFGSSTLHNGEGVYQDTNTLIGNLTKTSTYALDGKIEEVVVWNKALTEDEVANLYRKGASKLDLNVYTCSDSSCATKTDFEYFSDVNNNNNLDLVNLRSSTYLGYEAFFRPIDELVDYNAGSFWLMSYLSDVTVDSTAGNTASIATIDFIEGSDASSTLPYYSFVQDGLLDVNFSVNDDDNQPLTASIYFTDNLIENTSGTLVKTIDLNLDYCDSVDMTLDVNCYTDLNTQLASDGNYYLKIIVNDGYSNVYDFSSEFGLDNSPPTFTTTNTHSDWNRNKANIIISCSDSVSGCSSTTYRINNGTWNTYSSAISISGDGNYQIDFNSIDNKGNASDLNYVNVLVGFNGLLKTFNDENKPRSFFGSGERVEIVYDVNLNVAPTISIIDSSNTQVTSGTMSNISQDTNLGRSDLNTYYFEFDVNGEVGWYNVQIQNQLFEDAFYQSNVWVDAYTSNDGNTFPFSLDLNVYEPNVQQRWFYPIDTNIPFTFGTKLKSVRVLDFNGTHYKEIPAEIYSPTYSGSNISQANIVFLSSIDQNEIRNYFVSYSIVDINKNYLTDLNANWNSYELDVNSSSYFVQFDINKGASTELLRSKIGMDGDFNYSTEFDRAPMIDSDLSSNTYITSITAPVYTITSGNLIYKLNTSSLISFADYNLNYTMYAKNPYFLQDINIISRGAVYWDDYIDTNPRMIPNKFEKYSYLQNNSISTQDINALGNAKTLSDINYLIVYNKQLDSFGQIFLETDSSKTKSQSIAFRDLSNSLYWENTLLSVKNMVTGDYIHTKKAIVLSNPLSGAEDINKIFTSLSNPLTVIVGSTNTNDSGSAPSNTSIGYSPTDINSSTDVNCYSSWQDDTIINTIILNVSGPNTDVNYSFSVLDANGFVSQLVSSSYINAGDYNCNFIATDAAGNTDLNHVSFSVADISAPEIYSVINSPDGNANIDVDSNIVVDANIAEYTSLSSVTLYYRDLNIDTNSGWNDWQTITMNNDENYSDTNYNYSTSFIATENTWQYFVNAIDINSLDTNSSTTTIYAYDDYTWTFTPDDFGTKSGPLLQNITIGNLTINNTGDYTLAFKLSSNWDDKYAIWYDNTEETTSGYTFSIVSGSSEVIAVKVKAKATGKTDSLTINIDSTTTSADPSIDYSTATIISLDENAALYLEWVSTNNSATQGDTNVYYSARITNVGQQTATNVFYDWNFPSDWSINSGVESLSGFSLSSSSSYLSTISFNVSSSATTGNQTINFGAGCCSDSEKNQSSSTTTSVVAYSSGNNGADDTENTGGATGGPGASGAASSGGSIFIGGQADLFFQTNEFFELVRGQDNSFPIKFENPLPNKLINIELSVDGIISKYLRLKDSTISSLDSNEEFSTSIEIISPKYFTPGTYSLKFIIEGTMIGDYNREINFIEEREISLLIHDTNKETAEQYIIDMEKFLIDFNEFNFSLNDLPKLIEKSKNSFENNQFDEVARIFDEAKKMYDSAIEARAKSGQITGLVGFANSKGIETPNTDRLLMLAQLALQRGDYALALSRLKEAELMYSLETKGEFNFVIWGLANFDKLLLMIGLFLIAMYMFALGIKISIIKRKLKLLVSENKLLLSLIKGLQNQCFVENRISIGEYYDALTQYEERMAIVSEDMIEYTSKKNNLLRFSASAKRLEQERKNLLELIKETQKQYFEMGLIETRIYTTKLNSLTKRLSEVQEKIVSLELRKTQRLNEGIKKYFWIMIYKVVK